MVTVLNIEAPEDQGPQEAPPAPGPEPKKARSRRALTTARRELSDEELLSPAVPKLLLDDIDRLEAENIELSGFRSRFYDADKNVAVLEQKQSNHLAQEIISGVCITVGGAAIGFAPSVWAMQPAGAMILSFGVLLIACGVIAKAVKL